MDFNNKFSFQEVIKMYICANMLWLIFNRNIVYSLSYRLPITFVSGFSENPLTIF